jgi:hypothetical protein
LVHLVKTIESGGPNCGMTGSWKLETQSRLQQFGKWLEDIVRQMKGRRVNLKRYPRTYCAMYRREVLKLRPGMFLPSDGRSAGEELFFEAQNAGVGCRFLPASDLNRYVVHLNHATMALNQHFGAEDRYMPRTRARAIRRIRDFFDSIRADEILANHSLDG